MAVEMSVRIRLYTIYKESYLAKKLSKKQREEINYRKRVRYYLKDRFLRMKKRKDKIDTLSRRKV